MPGRCRAGVVPGLAGSERFQGLGAGYDPAPQNELGTVPYTQGGGQLAQHGPGIPPGLWRLLRRGASEEPALAGPERRLSQVLRMDDLLVGEVEEYGRAAKYGRAASLRAVIKSS